MVLVSLAESSVGAQIWRGTSWRATVTGSGEIPNYATSSGFGPQLRYRQLARTDGVNVNTEEPDETLPKGAASEATERPN